MATARTGRSSPPYVLIICIFLLVIAVVVDVLLYIDYGKSQMVAARSQKRLQVYIRSSEMSQKGVRPLIATARNHHRSVVAEAVSEINSLENRINGTSGVPVASLVGPKGSINKVLQSVAKPGNEPTDLVSAITGLHSQLVQVKGQYKGATAALAAARQKAIAMAATYGAQQTKVSQSMAGMNAHAKALRQRLAALHRAEMAEQKKLQAELTRTSHQSERAIRREVVKLQQVQEELKVRENSLALVKKKIASLRPKGESGNAQLYAADGKIIRSAVGSKMVFINIGAKQHVLPGMTFAVYSANRGISVNKNPGGKGAVRVVHVDAFESLARITHLKSGKHIFPGDLISNPAFQMDRAHKLHFVVYGDFDLNGTGVPTRSSYDKVVRLIKKWGGVVDKKLTTQTDFLVLGAPPANPLSAFPVQTRQTKAVEAARAKQQDMYNALIQKAHADYVPILNGNRFLALIGYYNNTVAQ